VSSREEILARVRRHQCADALPDPFTKGIEFDDPCAQFVQVLTAVGGRCEPVHSLADVGRSLHPLLEDLTACTVCSLVDCGEMSNFSLDGLTDPHDVQDVDFALVPGRLGVAENAAVWVTAETPVQRALYFLTQHLGLILPRKNVVSNLHQAYERLAVQATAFGCWISGPSKTADIEQSLVLGAHGPRTLTVFLLDE
jgi:L-lactate dehydrogenase complex protein LldG